MIRRAAVGRVPTEERRRRRPAHVLGGATDDAATRGVRRHDGAVVVADHDDLVDRREHVFEEPLGRLNRLDVGADVRGHPLKGRRQVSDLVARRRRKGHVQATRADGDRGVPQDQHRFGDVSRANALPAAIATSTAASPTRRVSSADFLAVASRSLAFWVRRCARRSTSIAASASSASS